MTTVETILRAKYGNTHPGLNLVGVRPFALPLSPFRLTLVVYESKEYALLNEYVLRCVSLGIRKVENIALTLGLDRELVVDAIADEQVTAGTIAQSSSGEFFLTGYGEEKLRDFKINESKTITRDVFVDRLTGRICHFNDVYPSESAALASIPEYVETENHMFFPETMFKDKIDSKFFTPEALNKIFQIESISATTLSVLDVLSARRRSKNRHYKIALLMIFADDNGKNIELELAIDGLQSESHRGVLTDRKLLQDLEIKVEATPIDPIRDNSFFSTSISKTSRAIEILDKFAEFPVLEEFETNDSGEEQPEDSKNAISPALLADIKRNTPGIFRDLGRNVRVRVQDHPALLDEAIQFAKSRILIISPWARSAVVNKNFCFKLERAAERGVQIDIGVGMGEDFEGSHMYSIDLLVDSAKKFPNFQLHKLQSHEKILIADNAYISTSFNWLSFKGVSANHYRRENGTRIVDKDDVNALYLEFMQEIREERRPDWP